MLDHAVTGVHYACSQSNLANGECQKRTTKSGVEVNVCSCNDEDFCNSNRWSSSLSSNSEQQLQSDEPVKDASGTYQKTGIKSAPVMQTANMASTLTHNRISTIFSFFIPYSKYYNV
ncbi:unnamed protein product [Anisakis simplex]|uniref:Activin_recp domain-containing protein n=1 Tax=Anisakis simplex TaxID=6269 RepID=A0A0M3JX38_ANISI|nr:unnamed protein product [Anisakis simplex]